MSHQKGERFWIKGLNFPEPRHHTAMVTSSTTNLDIQGKDSEVWKNLETNFSDAVANMKSLEDERGVSGTSKIKKQAFLSKAQDRSAFALEGLFYLYS